LKKGQTPKTSANAWLPKRMNGEVHPFPFPLVMQAWKITFACQLLKFSLHGSAKTAEPFRSDLPLTLHFIFPTRQVQFKSKCP